MLIDIEMYRISFFFHLNLQEYVQQLLQIYAPCSHFPKLFPLTFSFNFAADKMLEQSSLTIQNNFGPTF